MNHVQVIGTHNSYHIETTLSERPILESINGLPGSRNLYYSHPSLTDQFQYQGVRGLELDLFADSKGEMYATPLIRTLSKTPYPSEPEVCKLLSPVTTQEMFRSKVSSQAILNRNTRLTCSSGNNPAQKSSTSRT